MKVGQRQGEPRDFDPVSGIDTAELFAFIGATQGEEWEKVRKSHGVAGRGAADVRWSGWRRSSTRGARSMCCVTGDLRGSREGRDPAGVLPPGVRV